MIERTFIWNPGFINRFQWKTVEIKTPFLVIMKKLLFYLLIVFPVMLCAQQNRYKSSPTDYAWNYVGNQAFTFAGYWGQQFDISLVFSTSGQPYVAFTDWENSGKASVMKFNGTNWVYLGNAGFSAGEAVYVSLAFDSAGHPFVAFRDVGNFGRATVMKYDGTTWMDIGNAGFSSGAAWFTSLAFSPSDQPYLAYGDDGNSGKATVMKFNGTNWVNVGNAGFSAGLATYTSLAFSPSGQPYVAYQDHGTNNNQATVMKFDGSNWVNVGNAGFSTGEVEFTTIAFNPVDGLPYVSYCDLDFSNYHKATVMKFSEPDWVYVGNAGFSAGEIAYPSLAFSPAGEPFVAYGDGSNSSKASVMKCDGTSWSYVGNAGFSAGGEVWKNSIAFSPSGIPYIGYSECGNASCFVNVMKFDSVFVGIKEPQESSLSVSPNPSSDKITIEIPDATNEGFLTILNIAGQQVIRQKVTARRMQIDLSDLPGGIYFLKLPGGSGVLVEKIAKKDKGG